MPRFAYTARDRAGKSVSADLEAPSRKDALRLLTTTLSAVSTPARCGRPPAAVTDSGYEASINMWKPSKTCAPWSATMPPA